MSTGEDPSGGIPFAVTLTAGGAVAGYTIVAVQLGPAFAIPVGILACIATAVILRGPLGQALARRLERGPQPAASDDVLQAVDEIRGRMGELEERIDFAERVLAQPRDAERLRDQ